MNPMLSIAEAAPRIAGGQLHPRELVDACLERIAQLEDQVQAWVLVDEAGAQAAADTLGKEIAEGRCRGPLHGIPIGIKDIVDVAGMPTRAGSSLTDARPLDRDATAVARLREAGAVILGKTVTTEFACFDRGPTRNPWNLERTPGGSSSGSAAAVAAGMCLAAIASQTGGSIIRPASYCGLAGIKPSYGRVSVEGVLPLSGHLDHLGAIARDVDGLAAMLDVIADPPPPGAWGKLARLSPPKLGLLSAYFMETAEPASAAAVRAALMKLADVGAEMAVAALPDSFADAHMMHRRVMGVDAAAFHYERYIRRRDHYGKHIRALIEQGLATSPETYDVALAHQRRFAKDMKTTLEGFDALVMPSTPAAAPSAETTGDPRFNGPWSYSGLPSITIPCGTDEAGLPLGLQLVGAHGADVSLLSVAQWCQQHLGWDKQPPLTGAA